MSESASASVGQASSQATAQTSASPVESSAKETSQKGAKAEFGNPQSMNASADARQGQKAQSQPDQDASPEGDDEFEEIALGNVKGKVPKSLAKSLKEFERGMRMRVEKAAQSEKQLQHLMSADLDQFAKMRGVDLDEIAEQRLAKKYEMMQMSPEQRELHELREFREQQSQLERSSKQEIIDQIKQYASDLPKGIENATKEQLHEYFNHVQHQYKAAESALEQEIVNAWKESGLPKHKYFGALMSFHMMSHQKKHGEALQAADAAAKVKNEFGGHVREILGQMDAQAIHEFLGKDLLSKLREFDVQRVTSSQATPAQSKDRPANHAATGEKKQLNQIEWRKAMGLA